MHELKYDGYRILCRVKNGSAKLVTRNAHDWTAKLRGIAAAAASLPVKTAWLDGEVVALKPDGVISFQGLQNAFETGSETNLIYYVFDLLYLDGYDLRQVTLLDRKRSLAAVMPSGASGLIRYSDHIQGQGDVVFSEACRNGMEGIISKRSGAVYLAGRTRQWIKVKCSHRQEFVIGGLPIRQVRAWPLEPCYWASTGSRDNFNLSEEREPDFPNARSRSCTSAWLRWSSPGPHL